MFQSKEIGKYRTKESIFSAKKGCNFVTPKNNTYKIVDREKVGRHYHYIYEWVNAPEEIASKLTTLRFRSKTELSSSEIDQAIDEKIKIASGFYD